MLCPLVPFRRIEPDEPHFLSCHLDPVTVRHIGFSSDRADGALRPVRGPELYNR